MDLDERGVMFLEGIHQDGVFQKHKKLLKHLNVGNLHISPTRTVFNGSKVNIEFDNNEIKNIELHVKKALNFSRKRILFNLKNGEVYSFWCDTKNFGDITIKQDKDFPFKDFLNLLNNKTEALYNLLNAMIANDFNSDYLNNEIIEYNTKQDELHTEVQGVIQKQRKSKDRRNAGNLIVFCIGAIIVIISNTKLIRPRRVTYGFSHFWKYFSFTYITGKTLGIKNKINITVVNGISNGGDQMGII